MTGLGIAALVVIVLIALAILPKQSANLNSTLASFAPPSNAPPSLENWKSQLLTDRINEHVRRQQEAEVIALAQAAFTEPVTETTRKK